MRRFIRRPSPAMVVAFIALMAALAPTAAALRGRNIVSSNDIINGAVKKQDAGRDSVGKSEAREDSDPGGGFTGDQVNEGTFGTVPVASSVSHTAYVEGSTGSLVRGKGTRSAARANAGDYTVVFDRDVRACVPVGTIAGSAAGQISVTPNPLNASALNVRTFNGAGNNANRSFGLAVHC